MELEAILGDEAVVISFSIRQLAINPRIGSLYCVAELTLHLIPTATEKSRDSVFDYFDVHFTEYGFIGAVCSLIGVPPGVGWRNARVIIAPGLKRRRISVPVFIGVEIPELFRFLPEAANRPVDAVSTAGQPDFLSEALVVLLVGEVSGGIQTKVIGRVAVVNAKRVVEIRGVRLRVVSVEHVTIVVRSR